jgi:hypothetical protein
MGEISYIMGAGASYQSMPLVSNFVQRFHVYLNFLRITSSHNRNFIDDNVDFIDNIALHSSFDTFFKKLFHQNEIDSIIKFKNLLLYYFIFEHLCPLHMYNTSYGFSILKEAKKYKIDPRYESMIAGLLKPVPGQCQFYANVNFITWNYDLNILRGIRNFMYKYEPIKQIIARNHVEKNIFPLGSQIKIFHLNGFVNHQSLDDSNELKEQNLIELFQNLTESYYSKDSNLKENVKDLSFAWENVNKNALEIPIFIKSAAEAIKRSNSIIIVGYSFPLYNRLFDRVILSDENTHSKKIFIRDPRAEDIKEILHSDFGITRNSYKGATTIDVSRNCDSFFIPNQIFTET